MLRTAIAVVSGAVVAASLLVSDTAPIGAQQQPPAAGAQQPPPVQPPAGQPPAGRGEGRRGGGGGRGPAPIAFEDRTGFQPIFDGTSMKNWDGDTAYWRVEAGALVGESTEANPVKQNTFLIYRGGEPADFELKVEFRINSTNSGVYFQSTISLQNNERLTVLDSFPTLDWNGYPKGTSRPARLLAKAPKPTRSSRTRSSSTVEVSPQTSS